MAKTNEDYSVLEEQIGAAGGVPEATDGTSKTNGNKGLGKLKHPEAYGQRGSLDDDDRKSLEAFKERSTKKHEEAVAMEMPITAGWVPVNRDEMGERSLFYPAEWEFFIRPATVQAIKNWTAIDETRLDQVNRTFNEIIRTCVKIDTHNPMQGAGWARINAWDRFWFILKIREATFTRGETNIEFEDECSECGSSIKYVLTSDSLFYDFPDSELIEKYWTGSEWEINPAEYGVDHETIKLYVPTLGKDNAIVDWATARVRMEKKLDENFVSRFLPWMLQNPSRDPQMLARQIDRLYNEYRSWSVDMFDFMDDVIRNITVNPSDKLRQTCPACGQEATSSVRFPNGVRELFRTETKVKKFGSR